MDISKASAKAEAFFILWALYLHQLGMPSTVINSIEYLPESNSLKISYTSGQTYIYKNVPPNVYKELKASMVKVDTCGIL